VTSISVATLQAWSPPSAADDEGARGRDAVIDPREERAVLLEGDLWRVKVGDNGCDLTLELSATRAGRDSPHVVAMIPAAPGYEAARAAIVAAVGLRPGRSSARVALREPVRVRLTGYVFWDGARWCREHPERGCGGRTDVVASLWELRPVWRVEVVAASAGAEGEGRRHRGHAEHRGHHRHREE
jgi:hypothetical protein